MTDTNTSAEAVERLCKLVAMHGDDADTATLRALLARAERAEAERDRERSDREEWMRQHAALDALCTQREAERDEERAARERWQSQVQPTIQSLLKAEAERDAAIMDADMQAREAGNMEHNARVIMAERDEAIQRGNDWCDQARKLRDERDHARKAVELVIGDTAAELGCAPDNEAILKAIAALKAERDRLLKTLTTARAAVPLHWVIFSDERGLLVGILKEPAHD